jgi:hypothetical protein
MVNLKIQNWSRSISVAEDKTASAKTSGWQFGRYLNLILPLYKPWALLLQEHVDCSSITAGPTFWRNISLPYSWQPGSESVLLTRAARRHIPEDNILHYYHREEFPRRQRSSILYGGRINLIYEQDKFILPSRCLQLCALLGHYGLKTRLNIVNKQSRTIPVTGPRDL